MVENKIREKQTSIIHDNLLKRFWIVNIFKTINKGNLERNKNSLIINTTKIMNKRKENGELKNENECRGLLFSSKIVVKINKN